MKRILKLVTVLMVMVMAVTSLNLSAFAAPVDTREQEAVKVLKQIYSKMNSQQREKYVMILERASSEGNTELLKNHLKYVDKKYKPTGKKLSDKDYGIANKIAFTAANSMVLDFGSLNLPWALSSTLYAIGAALNLSWIPSAGQIVAIVVGIGAIAVFVIYKDELLENFDAIVKEFKRVYSNMATAITDAFYDVRAKVYEATGAEVDVEDLKNWTDGESEEKILDRVKGERGKTTKGDDGTIRTDVKDKATGKVIGTIHVKQPETEYVGSKIKYTGKKYPPHFHDKVNKLGKGADHHWYW